MHLPAVAGKVGDSSLRTGARWAIIDCDGDIAATRAAADGRDPRLRGRPEPRPHGPARGLHRRRRAIGRALAGRQGALGRRGCPRLRGQLIEPRRRLTCAARAACAIAPDGDLEHAPAPLDTLIVPGGWGHRAARRGRASDRLDRTQTAAAAGAPSRSAPAPSCWPARGCSRGAAPPPTGPRPQELADAHPEVEVDPDPIFIRDGSLWTSAGVTAGMDLALALVEEDHDRELALTIARHLVLFLRRPGSQSQFSATLGSQQPEREPLTRDPALGARGPRRRAHGRGDGRARAHEPAPLRPRVPRRDGRHAGALRRAGAPGGGPPAARGHHAGRSRRSPRGPGSRAPRRCAARSCAALGVSPAEYRRRFQGGPRPARPARRPAAAAETQRKGRTHGHRDRAVRQVHGARRGRPV